MVNAKRGGVAGPQANAKRTLEIQVLVIQCLVAAVYCVGAYAGLFATEGWPRTASVLWIASWHVFHAAYVIRHRIWRPISWVERITPIGDIGCVTAAWLAVGSSDSFIWSIHLLAFVGYSRRMEGRAYAFTSGIILCSLLGGGAALRAAEGRPIVDSNMAIMLIVSVATALMANAVASAWRRAEGSARTMAETDPLTGIANRRTFLTQIEKMTSGTYSTGCAVLMLDLDDFKRLNDERGHVEGDAVLVDAARILEAQVRAGDSVARYGGEEFVVLLPDATPSAAFTMADRLRQAIGAGTPCTVSIGCASAFPGESAASLIRRADDLLLLAKRTGKDTVRTDVPSVAAA